MSITTTNEILHVKFTRAETTRQYPLLLKRRDLFVLDIWNPKKVITTPKSSHNLPIDIDRDSNECQSASYTCNNSPNRFWTCRFPPRNKEISHPEWENILFVSTNYAREFTLATKRMT